MRTGFLCDVDLPNYITSPDSYNYLSGKHSATGYYYWILKNNNISDIHLVSPDDNLSLYDTIVYHYDNKESISHSCYNTIQVVSDRPFDPKADILIAANRHVASPVKSVEIAKRYGISSINSDWIDQSKWRFIHYPPTYGIKKCTAQWPPTNFKFVGREHTLIPEIKTPQFIDKCSRAGFNLILDFDSDGNRGDEDVYFCVRNVSHKGKTTGIENNFGPGGHRTANRLYQGWFMNTPCIFNISPEMAGLRSDELDYLIANDAEELFDQAIRLREDKDLFCNMIERCKSNHIDNPYYDISIIVEQWIDVLKYFK